MTSFITVPASTIATEVFHGDNRGCLGITIMDGQLSFAIQEDGGNRVMVARLHEDVVDELCGILADHLPALGTTLPAMAWLEDALCSLRH
ncbi:MAG: hypothetical protein J0H88_16365 [Sphingomonadales bacterium]|nr:hypothetical protein [Sphingomonadales bacterium]